MARTDRQRPATLRTIAQAAGVDVSTVSRVLNGSAEDAQRAASRETADEIRRWAARLNYRPNPHATSLRTARSNLVGVLVPRLSDLVLATIYEGVEDAAARHGLTTFVMNSHDRPEQQRVRTELALSRRVDGLVFGDAHTDAAFLDEIAERRIPFVLVSRHAGRHPAVTCDDHLGGRLVAEHLLGLGHRRVGVIAGEPFASTGADRTAGFVDRYRDAGLPVPGSHVVHSRFDAAGRPRRRRGPPPPRTPAHGHLRRERLLGHRRAGRPARPRPPAREGRRRRRIQRHPAGRGTAHPADQRPLAHAADGRRGPRPARRPARRTVTRIRAAPPATDHPGVHRPREAFQDDRGILTLRENRERPLA
ncbi:LacI family transcriptional regulator [Actinomadura madurae]|nr:LacI family DNA-binding transcriptional regulator [Actinomadura madurae]MCP9968915.1 LacI family transcriptional regulator [Actinomadura madurae]